MTDEKVSNALTGAAGVHFVVSELSRRGLIALPTIRNTPGYDVIVVRSDGKRHANIQVKTTRNKANFFLMPSPSKIRTGPRDFYACVRWLKAENRFEAFLLTGLEARLEVARSVREQQARKRREGRRGIWASLHVAERGRFSAQSNAWKRRWERWSL